MQGFSGKILPEGLEIFPENRRLDLAFPSNPGVTFAPRTEMTAWCGSLKGAKMEVNENRGWLGRKNFREKSVKKESPKGKRHHRKREKGKPQQRKYDCFRSDGTCSAGWQQSFFPVCPAVCGRLFHSWGRLTHSAFTFRFRQKRQRKKKNHLKTRKSTSWHRRKRKGHCFICLNIV